MSANLNTKVFSTGSSCGCGGAVTSSSTACGCGGAGCNLCHSQGGFARPRFFAGQLLTEEDLQLLDSYVVTKNRLHNRFLFGEGVVCGLKVTCHPCGDGRVMVHPGYALDCCGNDLVLTCTKTLDINAMARDLRRKLLGFDCGDPCAEVQSNGQTSNTQKPGGEALEDKLSTNQAAETDGGAMRHYCLYLRYCEELTDPVSPYSTSEPCGTQTCEPSRVREGVQFELRCRGEEVSRDDLFTRLCHCMGDLEKTEKSIVDARFFQFFAQKTEAALKEISANPVPPFEKAHFDALPNAVDNLNSALQLIPLPSESREAAGTTGGQPQTVSETALRAALDATLETASLVARFYARSPEDQDRLIKQYTGLDGQRFRAEESFVRAITNLPPLLTNTDLLPSLERESAIALLEIIGNKLIRKATGGSAPEAGPPAKSIVSIPLAADDAEVRLLAEGVAFTPRVMIASTRALDSLRGWLLDRYDRSSSLTGCESPDEVASLRLPSPNGPSTVSYSDAKIYAGSGKKLCYALTRYLLDCFCSILNPVCPPCDDTAVLLACLEIKDCKVVNICNLERKFVLSPSAVRYWFPPISLLGDLVEELCCPTAMNTSAVSVGDSRFLRSAISNLRIPSSVLSVLASVFASICKKDASQLSRVGRYLVAIFSESGARSQQLDPGGVFRRLAVSEAKVAEVKTDVKVETAAASILGGGLDQRLLDRIAALIDARVEARLAAEQLATERTPTEAAATPVPATAEVKPAARKNGVKGDRDKPRKGKVSDGKPN